MLSVDALREYGADVATGLARCVNRDSLYLRLVKMVPSNDGFAKLEDAIEKGDLEAAFQAAHGIKGAVTNLALDPLSKPVVEITEHLRAKEDMDYKPLLAEIKEKRDELAAICAD